MRRVLALALCISGCTCAEARTTVPTYEAPFLSHAPTIDGRLDDFPAPRTERFVDTMNGAQEEPGTYARMAWDDTNIYVGFEVDDDFLKNDLHGHDAHLWEQDTVEIMLDPGHDGRDYFELQLAPTEETFDTRYDSRRMPQPFGHLGWDSGMRGATVVRGTVNDQGDDEGYTAEMAIPWASFAPNTTPPGAETWGIALYVLDARRVGQRAVGWSPPLVGDFHVPDRFGRVVFRR